MSQGKKSDVCTISNIKNMMIPWLITNVYIRSKVLFIKNSFTGLAILAVNTRITRNSSTDMNANPMIS